MAHEPDVARRVPSRVALQLSGHTHGGQVRMLGWSPISPSGQQLAYGHIRMNCDVVVSGGLGCSIMPFRLGVPPEIVLVTLGASQQALFEQAHEETPGFAFVVRSMQLDFLRPARMDDVLDVVTWPVAVKGASITLAQEVRRSDEVLIKAEVRVAFISEGRAKPIPKSLRQLMKADLAPD